VKDAQVFLGQLESLFPGISLHWNGKVVASKAHLDPNYLCGYGNYLPGGYTQFCGFERVPEGNVFFAGEHTSIDFFGFFEGAAEEGWTSADGILRNRGLAFAPSMVGKVAAV
jgi:monoamine oxidase